MRVVDDPGKPPPVDLLHQVLERGLVHRGEQFAQTEQLQQLQQFQGLDLLRLLNVVEWEDRNEVQHEVLHQVPHGDLADRLLQLVLIGLVDVLHEEVENHVRQKDEFDNFHEHVDVARCWEAETGDVRRLVR